MNQNLNLYQIFYEVASCRNFSIAAQKLYISQPAISKSISKLEESLCTTLFHRSSRGVSLTSEGELLYKHVKQALFSLKSGEDMIRASSYQNVTHLSIGVSTTLCKFVLLPLLKTFIAENPNIKITISCHSTFDTVAALMDGTIDLGLVGLPPKADSPKSGAVTYLPLKTIEDIFVSTDAYINSIHINNKNSSSPKTDFFEKATFIMLDKENISRKHADSFLSTHQLALHNIIEVNNMDLSIEFAKAGLGIACVISDFVENDIKKGTLRELKLGHKVPKRQIGLAYLSSPSLPKSMNTLIQYCQARIN